ncbi:LOW QUALITY PROTEIN: hypothetical protein DAPPUDRAFT_232941 [Daphnia pulex]|uniref:Uncharacterized protein n=1 Tax=Daphnia pulex TaxID=6669 RepID=E9FSS0_DAPPU|nr:LOW QUALITY PROTEIN: hypothetical protein DAPPUDRAFT_232941 [Daphnia pulex]|eukprot:EFX89245.1 LOW QUALITY PROTEIN: hypothetical protein DAPPUDRAFT_232941 [Daphnia pulex]
MTAAFVAIRRNHQRIDSFDWTDSLQQSGANALTDSVRSSLSVFADGIQFNCYQVKLSSIGSSQLDTGEYADLVGAEGKEKKEKGTAVEGRQRKEKEEANPTADDWTGQCCVGPISSERIRLLHGQVHGLSPARLNRRASAVRQNRKGCEQGHSCCCDKLWARLAYSDRTATTTVTTEVHSLMATLMVVVQIDPTNTTLYIYSVHRLDYRFPHVRPGRNVGTLSPLLSSLEIRSAAAITLDFDDRFCTSFYDYGAHYLSFNVKIRANV